MMTENHLPPHAMFMTASNKPINISSTSIERAEQIMSQAATRETDDPFDNDDDDVDDDELCRACNECDELYNASQVSQTQQTENLTQGSTNGLKRKRLGVSTTPNERRVMIKKH